MMMVKLIGQMPSWPYKEIAMLTLHHNLCMSSILVYFAIPVCDAISWNKIMS